MKKFILFSIICLLSSVMLFSQAPNGIPYQALARDASSNLLANQPISLRFNIHNTTATGTIVFSETHAITTNALGLFSVNIGEGSATTGTIAGLDWSNGAKFLEVEMDATGGASYTSLGTTQMMSVPYALYAKTAESVTNDEVDDADADPNNEIELPTATGSGAMIYWNGTSWVEVTPTAIEGATLKMISGIPTWTE